MGRPALRLFGGAHRRHGVDGRRPRQRDCFSRTDSLGRTFVPRLNAFGYDFGVSMAENLAAGFDSGFSTYSQWRASPAHDTSMLNPNYRVMGVGHAYNPNSHVQVVLDRRLRRIHVDRTIPC